MSADDQDRRLAHDLLDAVRAGDHVPRDMIDWALEITGDARPNPESRAFAVFVATGPGTLQ